MRRLYLLGITQPWIVDQLWKQEQAAAEEQAAKRRKKRRRSVRHE